MFVEALVAHPALEALGEGVLCRFARGDVAPVEPGRLREAEDGGRGEFGAIVADDRPGLAAPGDQRRHLAHHPPAGDRGLRDRRAVTPDELPLGLTAVKVWSRDKFKGTAALKRKINPTRLPIDRKESVRWLDNLRRSTELIGAPERCVHIGDVTKQQLDRAQVIRDALFRAIANRPGLTLERRRSRMRLRPSSSASRHHDGTGHWGDQMVPMIRKAAPAPRCLTVPRRPVSSS